MQLYNQNIFMFLSYTADSHRKEDLKLYFHASHVRRQQGNTKIVSNVAEASQYY